VEGSGVRIRSLDGLRALSVALVILGHLGGTQGFPVGSSASALSFGAMLGVRVFLVISGYLITRGLLADEEAHGRIRLGSFYFRRIFRIFVPYYAFLAAMAAAAHFGFIKLAPGDLGYSLAYLSDHHLHAEWTHGRWTLGHTWSLAAEEQFYLLWPLLLVLLGARRALWVAAAALVAAPVGRLLVWYLQPEASFAIGKTFATVVATALPQPVCVRTSGVVSREPDRARRRLFGGLGPDRAALSRRARSPVRLLVASSRIAVICR